MNIAMIMKMAELSISMKQTSRLLDEATKLLTSSLEGVSVTPASQVAEPVQTSSIDHLKALTAMSGTKPKVSRKGMVVKRFTPEEDKKLKAAMEKADVNWSKVAKAMNRQVTSVIARAKRLQAHSKAKESA